MAFIKRPQDLRKMKIEKARLNNNIMKTKNKTVKPEDHIDIEYG
jgi:hypothetical protein